LKTTKKSKGIGQRQFFPKKYYARLLVQAGLGLLQYLPKETYFFKVTLLALRWREKNGYFNLYIPHYPAHEQPEIGKSSSHQQIFGLRCSLISKDKVKAREGQYVSYS
jgi:hypothetical protein